MAQKKLVVVLSLAVAFLVGCIVGQKVISPVRAGTSPTRWEYMRGLDKDANKAGTQGWELVAIDHDYNWCFKRPLP